MKGRILILTLLILFAQTIRASYTGRVYLDENKNGKYDSGEKGIADIMVSNGYDVVVSGKTGEYSLADYKKARFIYITIPSGYKTSGTFYQEITEGTAFYNFGLIKYKRTKEKVKFIQITDTETYSYDDWINNIRGYALSNNIGFMVHTGDICYEKGLEFHNS